MVSEYARKLVESFADSKEDLLKYINDLEQAQTLLNLLYAAGIDNWEGYEEAKEKFSQSDDNLANLETENLQG